MPTSTFYPPTTFGQYDTNGLSFNHVLGQQQMVMEIQDALDVERMGVAELWGNVEGQGTDTIRITHLGGVGLSRKFVDIATENGTIQASTFKAGYTDATIGLIGLAEEETFQFQILVHPQHRATTMEQLVNLIPGSYVATVRSKVCTQGAAISSTVGSSSTALSVENWLALQAVYTKALGSLTRGAPIATLHPNQLVELRDSAIAHPAFQNSIADFNRVATMNGQMIEDYLGMGINVGLTDDVTTSSGAYQGFAVQPGGIGIVRARVNSIRPANMATAQYIESVGIFIQRIDKGDQGSARHEARAWVGFAEGDSSVFTNRRILSAAA